MGPRDGITVSEGSSPGTGKVTLVTITNCNPEQMVKELDMHYQSLMDRVYTRQNTLLPVDHVDFGAKFMHETRNT